MEANSSHRITGSNCTYSDEVGSFSWRDNVKLFVPVYGFSNSQLSLFHSYCCESHFGTNNTDGKIWIQKKCEVLFGVASNINETFHSKIPHLSSLFEQTLFSRNAAVSKVTDLLPRHKVLIRQYEIHNM